VPERSSDTPEMAGTSLNLMDDQFTIHDVGLVLKQDRNDDISGNLIRYS
jgi:hypothetical protein